MADASINQRLDAVHERLQAHAARPVPTTLTDPDPDTPEERWDAGQVWAHMAEFVPYWLAELDKVVREYAGTPVPFGRIKTDAGRIAGIEDMRHVPVSELMARVTQAMEQWRSYLGALSVEQWRAIGLHQTRGEMDVTAQVDRFLLNHLKEHVDQLDLIS